MENEFLQKITEIIEENLSNEQFGVSELATKVGMSRSNLLRKVNKLTNLSASQFIRQVRLKRAMEMLREGSYNVSEVSYQVGFGSTSYFIKCFREHFGYPPGEVGKKEHNEEDPAPAAPSAKNRSTFIIGSAALLILLAVILVIIFKPFSSGKEPLEKSIAVLPFKNDSNDSTNIYLINGLMESILDHLQKIEDLRVISRTSVEQYRSNPKSIPEIAKELNANYLVEGSGQKIGDQILLHIQLIEASSDKHLWGEHYTRQATDIFKLQMEIAQRIADEIEAIITPEEEERINRIPTEDLVAYDYFLKGLDHFYKQTQEDLRSAIAYFESAIEQDDEFALAYAQTAISYFLMDWMQVEKRYTAQINSYADQALLFDPKLAQGLIAKALYYMNTGESELAVPHLEKALEYYPNSALIINILSDFYANYIPDTEKYLEYALRGISIDIAANDSLNTSYIYMHVSNALLQYGFIDEAVHYIDRSLAYNPDNLYSEYLKAFILYAKDENLQQTRERLIETLNKDTTRLDIMQEIGKICYFMRDFESAYQYYRKFIDIREALNLTIYRFENAKIGVVLAHMGEEEESELYFRQYKQDAENTESVYRHLSLAVYYAYTGDTDNALKELDLFSEQTYYNYLLLPMLRIDPLVDRIKDLPEFNTILREMDVKFWEKHNQIKASLRDKGLL